MKSLKNLIIIHMLLMQKKIWNRSKKWASYNPAVCFFTSYQDFKAVTMLSSCCKYGFFRTSQVQRNIPFEIRSRITRVLLKLPSSLITWFSSLHSLFPVTLVPALGWISIVRRRLDLQLVRPHSPSKGSILKRWTSYSF